MKPPPRYILDTRNFPTNQNKIPSFRPFAVGLFERWSSATFIWHGEGPGDGKIQKGTTQKIDRNPGNSIEIQMKYKEICTLYYKL